MRILIVEDDENKRNQVAGFIRSRFNSARVSTAKSLQSGLRNIILGNLDLVVLDMTMPTFDIGVDEDGGRPQAYAGLEILRQMDRRDISTPVVVLTQFDRFGEGSDALALEELNAKLRDAHPETYLGAVYYNVSVEGWKEKLSKIILDCQSRRVQEE